ncbi:MAG: hypothetical protein ABJC05_05470 [Pyrinomonadaceae bacterium]
MNVTISKRARGYTISGVVLMGVVLLAAANANAQSGRRAPKGTVTVPSVSGPKTVEKKPVPETANAIPLLVAIEDHNPFSGIPYYLAGTVRDTCVDRLRKSPDVKVGMAERGMNRSEAIKLAKTEKETYVVWLQIESDSYDNGRSGNSTPDSLYVRYTIYTPVTAKIKASGRAYKQIYRNGKGGVLGRIPSSRGGSIYSEYALKQAAQDAAEQILHAFLLSGPDGRLPG